MAALGWLSDSTATITVSSNHYLLGTKHSQALSSDTHRTLTELSNNYTLDPVDRSVQQQL